MAQHAADRTGRAYSPEDAARTARIGILDAHTDIASGLLRRRFDGVTGSLKTDWLPALRAGGVKILVAAIYIDSVVLPEGALRRAVQMIDALFEEIELCSDSFGLARTSVDIDRILADGKIAVVLSFEGAEPLGQDLSALRLFRTLGLRMLSFCWMRRTLFGDGTWENDTRGGLSRLGHDAVAEMNRLGIVIDVSHASDETTSDTLRASTKPVVASHSNARAVRDHPRNLTDEHVTAIASSGGVVGVVAVSRFVAERQATVSDWADHVDYLVNLAGLDHVGIGCDFFQDLHEMGATQGIPAWRPDPNTTTFAFDGMSGWQDLPGLTAELVRRGYSDEALAKVYNGNFRRVLRDVIG